MPRTSCLLAALALALPTAVAAQVRIVTPDGWTFTFAGNVGAFYVFETERDGGTSASPGVIVGSGGTGSAVRSGYLPAFAVLDARGTEGTTELGAHFGLAPVIQTAGGHDDAEGLGARVDLRQAYLTVGGGWGEILAGREVGVFGRQAMLDDMSLFGTGATGGITGNPGGTTLGHSGFGYIYPGFNAQIAYSTPRSRALQATLALFDPSVNNGFDELVTPRLEGELSWGGGGALLWTSGLLQPQRDATLGASAAAWGAMAGGRVRSGTFTFTASGYTGRGIGTTRMFEHGRTADPLVAELRPSAGFLGQASVQVDSAGSRLGVAFGQSVLDAGNGEPDFRTRNSAATLGAYLQATRSLKVVGEVTHAWSDDGLAGTATNRSTAVAAGMLLFF